MPMFTEAQITTAKIKLTQMSISGWWDKENSGIYIQHGILLSQKKDEILSFATSSFLFEVRITFPDL